MRRTYEAWTRIRLVRTFNTKDLAEAYKAEMAKLETKIEIKVSRLDRRAA